VDRAITIRSPQDFARLARPAYDELVRQGREESLDIVVEAGDYGGSPFLLVDLDTGSIAVRIRAADPLHPPRFVDAHLSVSAASVEVEHLVFENTVSDRPLLTAVAKRAITLSGCAFVGNTPGVFRSGGTLLDLSPGFAADGSAAVTIRDSWFIGNRSGHDWSMLRLPATPLRFHQLRLARVAFVDNAGMVGIQTGGTGSVECLECWLDGSDPLLALFYGGTRVVIDRSSLMGTSLDGLIRFGTADSYADPIIRASRVYVDEPGAADERFRLEGCELLAPPSTLVVADLRMRAAQGLPPDVAILRRAYGMSEGG